jgi:formyl-CoA transferase
VLDLVEDAGAYGPKLLAGMGADVVRVELPGGSDQRRRLPLYRTLPDGADAFSLYFLHYNSGKRGITLDYRAEQGRSLLRRLLDSVDLVFDNGQLFRLGLDPEALAGGDHPLVTVSQTPFGLEGERAHWLGGDLVCQAMSGMIHIFGFRNERPARFGPEQASEMSGLAAALGAVIALLGARRHGVGEFVDIAMERVGALVTLQMSNASMYEQFGFRRERLPRVEAPPGGLYEALDGYVALVAYRDPALLRGLFEALGAADEVSRLRDIPADQIAGNPEIDAMVVQAVSRVPRQEISEAAQGLGILSLPVNDAAAMVADPFLQERAFFVDIEHPELDATFVDAGTPLRFSASPYRISRRPPLLGEHNAEVYEALGVDSAQLATLQREGVV